MTDLVNIMRDAEAVKEAPPQPAYTGVRIYVGKDQDGDDLYYFRGNETGSVLEFENPYGDGGMASSVLSAISGYSYKPMQADGALLDPAAELGDAISVNGVYSVLAKNDIRFGNLLVSDIAAPSDGELGHEYPYTSKQRRETQREINQASTSLSIQLGEIKGQVTDDDGNYTVVTIKSDGLYVGGASATLNGSNITSGSIGTTQIAGGAITTNKIAANAITTNKIDAGAVTAACIDTKAVTASKIDSEAVTTSKLLLTGMLSIYNSSSKTASASLGYGQGDDGTGTPTYGAKLAASSGSNYMIVTNAGARMTASSKSIYCISDGCYSSEQIQTASDESIKTDVDDDLSKYKDVLMHLRPVSFKYVPEWTISEKRYTGLIAQEAEAVMEDYGANDWALAGLGGMGLHSVSYEALIPVLVSCIQDLTHEVAELKEQING